jgi:hypothetical protein
MKAVIPGLTRNPGFFWIPAFAGMTRCALINLAMYNTASINRKAIHIRTLHRSHASWETVAYLSSFSSFVFIFSLPLIRKKIRYQACLITDFEELFIYTITLSGLVVYF